MGGIEQGQCEGGREAVMHHQTFCDGLSLFRPPHLISSTPAAQMIVVAAVTRACAVCRSSSSRMSSLARLDGTRTAGRVDVTGNQ